MSCLILPNLTRSGSCTLVMGEGRSGRKEEPVLGFLCDACNDFFLGETTSCRRVSCSHLSTSLLLHPYFLGSFSKTHLWPREGKE